jgi:hypothetical protein
MSDERDSSLATAGSPLPIGSSLMAREPSKANKKHFIWGREVSNPATETQRVRARVACFVE